MNMVFTRVFVFDVAESDASLRWVKRDRSVERLTGQTLKGKRG